MPASRRAWLKGACAHCASLGAFSPLLAHAQSDLTDPLPVPEQRFLRPAADTDEAGLWALMERDEARARRTPLVVRDPALNSYLKNLVCSLAGPHCPDVRVLVVRTPHFNASMAPNGLMLIWTGLLLRVENEAQLASVISHEIGHYVERHTLQSLRDLKSRAAFAQFLSLFGLVGALGALGILAGAYSFSREQETRADRIGMQLMLKGGYDGAEATKVWDNLLTELQVRGGEDVGRRSPMFATHPPPRDRAENLKKWSGGSIGRIERDKYQAVVSPSRALWLEDELRRGQYDETLTLLNRLLRGDAVDPLLLYTRAEAHRARAAVGDVERAMADLQLAVQQPHSPPEAYRSMGLIHRQIGAKQAATTALSTYIERAPQAPDIELIKSHLQELQP